MLLKICTIFYFFCTKKDKTSAAFTCNMLKWKATDDEEYEEKKKNVILHTLFCRMTFTISYPYF